MTLRARIHDNHLVRALKHKYQEMDAGPERNAVAHAIADDDTRQQLLSGMETKASQGVFPLPPDGVFAQFLKWLEANWKTILEEILKLFGVGANMPMASNETHLPDETG